VENLDNDIRDEVVPFYFGTSPKRLYGCHHIPQVRGDKAFAVLLCPSIGQEYLTSHRVLYQLATLLSKAGFHVLRFDYFGCGDSEGDFEMGSLRQWNADVFTAIGEIQKRSGLSNVCLVGLRIGATLALRTAADCSHVGALVLWEAVMKGGAYVKQLQDLHQEFMSHNFRYRGSRRAVRTKGGIATEALGFPITPALFAELASIDLDNGEVGRHVRSLALWNSEESIEVGDPAGFVKRYPQADVRRIDEAYLLWNEFNKRLTPVGSLRFIVDWVQSVEM
jgi:uncharacterized protein